MAALLVDIGGPQFGGSPAVVVKSRSTGLFKFEVELRSSLSVGNVLLLMDRPLVVTKNLEVVVMVCEQSQETLLQVVPIRESTSTIPGSFRNPKQ